MIEYGGKGHRKKYGIMTRGVVGSKNKLKKLQIVLSSYKFNLTHLNSFFLY